MLSIDGRFFITGTSGPRHWLANLTANAELTLHVGKHDLAAHATVVSDDATRRRVLEHPSASWYRSQEPTDTLVRDAPMVEVDLSP